MLRKLSFSIILIIILSIFFSNSLIKLVTVYNLSKWTKKEVNINSVKLNYSKKEIVIKNLLIKNKEDGLYFKNLFIVEKIIINLKFSSIFNNPVIIDRVLFKNPKYYLELFDDPENDITKKNNIALSDSTISNDKPKIYKKKKIDVNFLISKIAIKKPTVVLKSSANPKEITINLSEMNFFKVGNSKNTQHYKDVFKIIITDLFFRIPDQNLQKKIKKNYNLSF
tara:strand:+ start:207 stop:878 length:672 start_codon:yes stop_codon:yes gene_type:complete